MASRRRRDPPKKRPRRRLGSPRRSSARRWDTSATGVTVVTSVGEDGGTTANAVTSLSLDPPLLLVCCDLSSATLRTIRSHGAFVVNAPGHRQRYLSANFARRGLAAARDGVRHRRGPTGSTPEGPNDPP
jgi:flavin reductase (DIM6/NTAB) family NADH-FMN oxidoreductase RutF